MKCNKPLHSAFFCLYRLVGPHQSLQALLQNKYLIDCDGAGASFRYKNLLLSHSLVFKVQEDMYQFYDDEFLPWVCKYY